MTDWAEECEDLPLMDLPVYPEIEYEADIIANYRRLIFKCATCKVEVTGEDKFVDHCLSASHISVSGRRGFTGLIPNKLGALPNVNDALIKRCSGNGDTDRCACNKCDFLKHSNPPAHFDVADHAYCCSLCRMSKGREHGGHCEKQASSKSKSFKGNGQKERTQQQQQQQQQQPQHQQKHHHHQQPQQQQQQQCQPSFVCTECGESFSTKKQVNYHFKQAHQSKKQTHNDQQPSKMMVCCNLEFQNDFEFNCHFKQFHSCPNPKKETLIHSTEKLQDNGQQHLKKFVCQECGQGFVTHKQLKNHYKLHHSTKEVDTNTPTSSIMLSSDEQQLSVMFPELTLSEVVAVMEKSQGDMNDALEQLLATEAVLNSEKGPQERDDGFVMVTKKKLGNSKSFKCAECGDPFSSKTELNEHKKGHNIEGLTPKAEEVGGGWMTVVFGNETQEQQLKDGSTQSSASHKSKSKRRNRGRGGGQT